jgi:hypothetical protein
MFSRSSTARASEKRAVNQRDAVAERLEARARGRDRGRISVQADHPTVRPRTFEHRERVPARAQGRVAVQPARLRVEPHHRFFEHDRQVRRRTSVTRIDNGVTGRRGHGGVFILFQGAPLSSFRTQISSVISMR